MKLLNILTSAGQSLRKKNSEYEEEARPEVQPQETMIDNVEPLNLDFSERDLIPYPDYSEKSFPFYKTKCKSESEIDDKLKITSKLLENDDDMISSHCSEKFIDSLEDDEFFDDFDEFDGGLSTRLNFSSNPEFSRLYFDSGSVENSPKLKKKIQFETIVKPLEDKNDNYIVPKAQRNDREEIRKKLAMASDVEEDCFSDDKSYRKTSSRALTGKNLQICFMNEDQDQTTEVPESSASTSISAEVKTKTEPVKTGKPNTKSKPESSVNEKKPHEEGDEDFFKKQARLQREARAALAQASTMAHMQLEVERQQKKKSPIAEIVGIPYIGDNRRQRVGLKLMYEMNVAQLQVVVNDLHTQIENLNEELVKLLMERDELHMSQDSMLVDIEDLSRRAEETAVRVNAKQVREHSKS
ncbi:hypothetical protein FSP39_005373 [Pinctada imbricata]|uniref:Schwannomin interacting protein 1 C-terminal domain-containing protein n=1 Tax=Pinctada imbricata TaxID=66713 RepID=A0AA88YDV6_PINIB|nr:hypothetical protein FSP39_005373 [Pinctada imbricata]